MRRASAESERDEIWVQRGIWMAQRGSRRASEGRSVDAPFNVGLRGRFRGPGELNVGWGFVLRIALTDGIAKHGQPYAGVCNLSDGLEHVQ